jgi:hypothetical protein
MTTLFETRQNNLLSLGDGNVPANPMLRMGIPAEATAWDLFALMGRMFNAKQTTIGTALAGAAPQVAAIVLTAPWFRFTVPTGYTVFPRHLNVSLQAATGTDNEIALCYSETDSFDATSAGTAITPVNWRSDNPRSSIVTSCYVGPSATDLVETGLTRVRALFQHVIPTAFGSNQTDQYVAEKWFPDMVPIIGPASVLLYLAGATATPTATFSMDWAEIPTVSVKAS